MAIDRTDLVQQVLGLRTELYGSLRRAAMARNRSDDVFTLKVLFLLYSAECASMGQLAASLAVTLSTVTGIVDRPVTPDGGARGGPHDRRLVVSRLTHPAAQRFPPSG